MPIPVCLLPVCLYNAILRYYAYYSILCHTTPNAICLLYHTMSTRPHYAYFAKLWLLFHTNTMPTIPYYAYYAYLEQPMTSSVAKIFEWG